VEEYHRKQEEVNWQSLYLNIAACCNIIL
jgi:hypothetical protein